MGIGGTIGIVARIRAEGDEWNSGRRIKTVVGHPCGMRGVMNRVQGGYRETALEAE